MKQNILFKVLPMMAAAVLFATSCSKDSDGNSNVVPTPDNNVPTQEQVENLQPRTVPFTVTVTKDDSSLSKSSVERDGEDNKLHQKFIVGDVLVITGDVLDGEKSILTLVSGDENKETATFTGDLYLAEGKTLVKETTKLTATLHNTVDATKNDGIPVSSIEPTSSIKRASSLHEAFEKYGYLTAENFTYDGDENTEISLVQHTRFIAVDLPFSGAKVTITVNDGTAQAIYLSKECALAFPADATVTVNSTTLDISNHTISKAVTWIRSTDAKPRITPTGCIPGLFSVGSDMQVFFSEGNLQATYENGAWSWGFASNQYDIIGNNATNTSINGDGTVSENGTVDLFGWVGTGHKAEWTTEGAIHGICNSVTTSEYGNGNLKSDWGNLIKEGGPWRTLTGGSSGEWQYLFNSRGEGKYGHGKIGTVTGMIILPDDWTDPKPNSKSFASGNQDWSSANQYTTDEWNQMEAAGAVFLPAAGFREGTSVSLAGSGGYYWSSTANGTSNVFSVFFYSDLLYPGGGGPRDCGQSVRLVRCMN